MRLDHALEMIDLPQGFLHPKTSQSHVLEDILKRVSNPFTSNGKREFVSRDQVSSLLVIYCSLFLHLD